MNIVRWNPFRELDDVQSRLNRVFGDAPLRRFGDFDSPAFAAWAPAADIEETEKEYVIKADLPDVKKDDVKVEFEDGVLTLEGERRLEKEEKGRKFHKIEREYGKFIRRFTLPTEVDPAKVSAEFKDGVLSVHLPKSANGRPKSVQIKVS